MPLFWHQIQQEGIFMWFSRTSQPPFESWLGMKFMSFKPASQFGCVSGAMAESKREKFQKRLHLHPKSLVWLYPKVSRSGTRKHDVTGTALRPRCCLTTSSPGVWQWSKAHEWKLPEDCDQKLCFYVQVHQPATRTGMSYAQLRSGKCTSLGS